MIGLLLIIIVCYVTGRAHQWAKGDGDRQKAYREGYDAATHSLFTLATRAVKTGHTRELPTVQPQVPPPSLLMPVEPGGRTRRMAPRGPRHAR